jgi:hypothetical protein
MLSVSECQRYLTDTKVSDKQLEQLRDKYYLIVNKVIDDLVEKERGRGKK